MQIKENKKYENEFTKLMADYLAEELTPEGTSRLKLLTEKHPDLKHRFEKIMDTDALLMDHLGELDLEAPEVQSLSQSRRGKLYLLPAAAAVLFLIGVTYTVNRSTDVPGPVAGTKVVYKNVLQGKLCSTENGEQRLGQPVNGKSLRSGKESICDIQFANGGNLLVRMGPDTQLNILRATGKLQLHLVQGQVFIDSEKLKTGESLEVFADGLRVRFLGTRVRVQKNPNGKTRVNVIDGRVSLALVGPLLSPETDAALKPSQRVALRKKHPEFFQQNERILGPGVFAEIRPYSNDSSIQELKTEIQKKIQTSKNFISTLDRAIRELTPGQRRSIKTGRFALKAGKNKGPAQKAEVRQFKTLDRLAPGAFENREEIKKLASRRNPAIIAGALKKKKPRGRLIQRLLLQDGRTLEGKIYRTGRYYILESPGGRKIKIKAENVRKLENIRRYN